MLLYFLLPILCNALLLAACKLPKLAPAGSEFSKTAVRMGILAAGEILVLLLLHALIRGFQITGSHLFPPLPLAITLLLLGAGTAFSGKQDTAVLRKYLRKAACIAGCVFLLEVLVFHITGFTTQKTKEELPLSTAEISDEEAASFNDKGEITITGNCTLTFSDLDWDELHCVRLHADGKDKMYQVSLSMKDNNLTQRFEKTAQTQATGSYDTLQFAMQPYEKIHVLQLQFENIDAPITLHSGTAYAAIPFAFSTERFLLVLLIALGLTACKQFSVWEIHYQAKNWKHNLAVLMTLFGCLACISAFIVPDQKPTDMHSVDISNVYGKTLEAWTDGHSYMNFDVTPELAELENPYDNSNRDGVSYNWDYAYYNEHYYCYFGCAPVVLIYLPFYAITGKVPTLNFAYCITVAAIIIAIFGLIMTLVRRYDKQPPLLLLLFGLVSAVAGCGAFVGLNYNDRYYLCLLMGMFGLLLALWTGFAAVSVKKSWKRFALLAVSGIGVVITAASRPNLLVYVLLLVPIFLHLLFRKDLRLQNRLISAGCFLLPTLVGAAAIMWYNQIRFDSPLQFGAIYQMTVDNTAANRISLARFPAAFAAYFLHPMELMDDFPFLKDNAVLVPNHMMYLFVERSFGALAMPSVLLGVLSIPLLWKKWKQRDDCRIRRALVLITVIGAVLLAWVDYCMAGITIRYLLDIMVVLSVMSTMLLLQVPAVLKPYSANAAQISQKVIALAMTGTVLAYFCILITSGDGVALYKAHPTIWNVLKDTLVFWR